MAVNLKYWDQHDDRGAFRHRCCRIHGQSRLDGAPLDPLVGPRPCAKVPLTIGSLLLLSQPVDSRWVWASNHGRLD